MCVDWSQIRTRAQGTRVPAARLCSHHPIPSLLYSLRVELMPRLTLKSAKLPKLYVIRLEARARSTRHAARSTRADTRQAAATQPPNLMKPLPFSAQSKSLLRTCSVRRRAQIGS